MQQAHFRNATQFIDDYIDPIAFLVMIGHGEAWVWMMVVDLTRLKSLGLANGFGLTQKTHEYELFHQEGGYKNFESELERETVHATFMKLVKEAETRFA